MANSNDTKLAEKKVELTASERFTAKVMTEFGANVKGELRITDYQRTLIQGYFVVIDKALKAAEAKRYEKTTPTPYTWQNVNLADLALDVVYNARMGLDMTQKNVLFPIPYKNNKTGLYDITLMQGYNGIKFIAEKYCLGQMPAVTVEVVYENDVFKPLKKGIGSRAENYEFDIQNPFSRGAIVGGFIYYDYVGDESRNRLIMMSLEDILKRKPKKASPEFWGGDKDVWESGKKTGSEHVDGWFKEMVEKTLIREAYSEKNIARDPQKVDDAYQHMKAQEARFAEIEAAAERAENANKIEITGTLKEPEQLTASADHPDTTPEAEQAAPATDGFDE